MALITCKGRWEDKERFWLLQFPWPVTQWNKSVRQFLSLMTENHRAGVKTNVLVPDLGENAAGCLNATFLYKRFHYFVAWILMDNSTEAKSMFRRYVSQTSVRNFTCHRTEDGVHEGVKNRNAQACFGDVPTVYYRGCSWGGQPSGMGHHKRSDLRNKVIRVGCLDATSSEGVAAACLNSHSALVWNALRFYNVTLEWVYYTNSVAFFSDLFDGFIDIYGNLGSPSRDALRDIAVPAIIQHTHETFYAVLHEPLIVSFFDILSQSNLGFLLVAVSFAVYLLALAVADYEERTQGWLNGSLDSFATLLASFFATSSPIPQRRRWATARHLLYGFWLMGILPLSNYLRGELISRVSLRAPPGAIDTLRELEDALNRQKVTPCVVMGSSSHHSLETEYGSTTAIHQKLRSAFLESSKREMLVSRSAQECLSCAERDDRVCFLVEVPKCLLKPRVVTSTESLKPVFATMAVRKNFPYFRAYNSLLRKAFEGSLFRDQRDVFLCELNRAKDEEGSTRPKLDQMAELEFFFLVFTVFLVTSTAVFFVELLISCLVVN
ncbi:hypothetical protein V5799_029919 [Amblyomma americanum]|uniref:Uncharacterized protein n=1 Tax=Amblyomma americanum TaxID=6943 RepID=A0AAQ4EPR1_AMBAM